MKITTNKELLKYFIFGLHDAFKAHQEFAKDFNLPFMVEDLKIKESNNIIWKLKAKK